MSKRHYLTGVLVFLWLVAGSTIATAAGTGIKRMPVDVSLSPAERVEIWRRLGEQAAGASIPAGLGVGQMVPSTAHVLSFSADLRERVPAIVRFDYTLAHDQILIVDPQSMAIVSIVAK
jgi:hypothetical protein